MTNYCFIDTSVFIDEPTILFNLKDTTCVVTSTVIEELDGIRKDTSKLRSIAANETLTYLDELTAKYGKLVSEGIPLENGSKLIIELKDYPLVDEVYSKEKPDNEILAVVHNYAKCLEEREKDFTVTLLSNDKGLRVKAKTLGIQAEGYFVDNKLNKLNQVYKGFREIVVEPQLIGLFYKDGYFDAYKLPETDLETLYVNEFVTLRSIMNPEKQTALGRVGVRNGKIVIKKLILSDEVAVYGIRHLDAQQLMALELLMDKDVPMVTIIGKAGTGKTLLALAAGLQQLETGDYRRVLALRTLVVVGKKEVGFLPGELEDKLRPYMMPYYDNLEFLFENRKKEITLDEILNSLEGKLIIDSTGFMRGRTLPYQYIIVDEAQNLTKHEVKTLITRIGIGGKIVLMGDPNQIDDPYLDSVNNGLVYATERMKHVHESGTIFLTGKSKRSTLAELASELL